MCLHRALVGLLGATFMVALSVSKPESQARYRLPEPLQEVARGVGSQEKQERQGASLAARNFRLRLIEEAIAGLEESLQLERDPEAPWGMPWSLEDTNIRILAEYRAAQGVPVLIKCLARPWAPSVPGPNPARRALAKIGLPARAPLIEFMSNEPTPPRQRGAAVQTLQLICGPGAARLYLEEAIAKAADAEKKANLQAAVEYLKERE